MRIEPLWNDFHERLRYFMLSRTKDMDLSEDLTQEVFVRIHANLNQLRQKDSLDHWIYRIARNVLADHYRKQHPGLVYNHKIELSSHQEDQTSVEQRLAESLRSMILGLPPKYRDALWMTDIEGFTQAKLAQVLDISLSGAKSRVQRARKLLKDMLMKCCHFEFDRRGAVIDCHPISCCCCSQNTPRKKSS